MAARGVNAVYLFGRYTAGGKLPSSILGCQSSLTNLTICQRGHGYAVSYNALTLYDRHKSVCAQDNNTHSLRARRFFHPSVVCLQSDKPLNNISSDSTEVRGQSSSEEQIAEDEEDAPIIPTKDEKGQALSNWARMKFVMKTYGYVVIPVHWVIAPVWFGGFYYAIKLGVDIEPLLSTVGVSDHHIETLKNSRASTALMAYALYKIFTPFRYTLTLGATEVTIRALRKRGYIKPTPPKEKTYRQSIKDTADAVRDRIQKEKEK